jgi:hypothetical protein
MSVGAVSGLSVVRESVQGAGVPRTSTMSVGLCRFRLMRRAVIVAMVLGVGLVGASCSTGPNARGGTSNNTPGHILTPHSTSPGTLPPGNNP